MERLSYQDYEPGKVFIVFCGDCEEEIASNLLHCTAQEFAFDHSRRTGHSQVYLLSENDLEIIDTNDSRTP